MFYYSKASKKVRGTLSPKLTRIFDKALEFVDHKLIEGNRGKEKQNKAFYEGRSKIKYPNGKHNKMPSEAVDASIYPIRWPKPKTKTYIKDICRFYYFAGIVLGIAFMLGEKIRWGGDWDRDHDILDQRFDDLVHFEEYK